MSIILQGFYWDCPHYEAGPGKWWNYLDSRLDSIARLGVKYIWLPPLSKSCQGQDKDAMGYDAFDYYDLGDYDQSGSRKTLFGNRAELTTLISHLHARGIAVIAELCLSHCRGGESEENPYTGGVTQTLFKVKSGRFQRNYEDFTPCRYDNSPNNSPWKHIGAYDYCYTSPHVYAEFLQYAAWLKEELGVDAFRYDNVKAYPSLIPLAIQRYLGVMSIGEFWDEQSTISRWLQDTQYTSLAYDFPLRGRLADMCNHLDYDLRQLWGQGLVFEHPHHAVTFVENHDTERDFPILQDKILAYAFILCMEGLPTIFWRDYYTDGMDQPGSMHGLERLVFIHHHFTGGRALLLTAEDHLLALLRTGDGEKSGLVLIINSSTQEWNGSQVNTPWKDTTLIPVAWSGRDLSRPRDQYTNPEGSTSLWAAPRGYAVYVPVWAEK